MKNLGILTVWLNWLILGRFVNFLAWLQLLELCFLCYSGAYLDYINLYLMKQVFWDQLKTSQADTVIRFCLFNSEAILANNLQTYQVFISTPRQKNKGQFKHVRKKETQNREVNNNKSNLAAEIFIFISGVSTNI